ncbi:MAG TPA: cytochrome c oxidase subunit II [Mycobacteriales bacterium]|nr:cytochrome c oxidase subunit II [Mycobacteriales bacterium]
MLTLGACSRADLEDDLRFGWPRGITDQAQRMRELWTWSTVAALVVGALVWGLIFWASIVYRRRGSDLPRQTKYNLPIEALYTVVPFLIVAVLFYYTAITQSYVTDLRPPPDTTVSVTAFKWNWQFNYNDRRDPRTDEFVYTVGSSTEVPVLVVPENKNVRFVVGSNDVIHSFWVPETLFKRDVFPAPTKNQNNQFQLRPTVRGSYVGRCAELCGTYHSQMNFEMRVVADSEYQRYLDALATFGNDDIDRQAKALSAIGQAPQATTTYPFETDRQQRAPSEPRPDTQN